MASGRYSRYNSKYILSEKHMDTEKGVITERDFGTLGERQRLEKGKRMLYTDSNFIFTVNKFGHTAKKHNLGKWAGYYTYQDVINTNGDVNEVKVSYKSQDLRDFAYYGSCAELIRTSIENIAHEFPGRITTTDIKFKIDDEFGEEHETGEYIIYNPFEIDLHHNNVVLEKYDNVLRYLSVSWPDYIIKTKDENGEYTVVNTITSYTITEPEKEVMSHEKFRELGYNYILYNGTLLEWNEEEQKYIPVEVSECSTYYIKCGEYIRQGDSYYKWSEELGTYEEIVVSVVCYELYRKFAKIVIGLSNDTEITINGYREGNGFIFASDTECIIQPKEEYIEEYFSGLDGIEALLLTRETDPLYTNRFLTPQRMPNGLYNYVYKTYTWPSDDYCINVTSPMFFDYVNTLSTTAEMLDESDCDAIWRCMTHEAIQNFDWSYRAEYNDNDTEDNIEGGNRMKSVLRWMGRVFDDVKRSCDGIRFTTTVTLNGNNNVASAEISDKTDIRGWENTSTIYQYYFYRKIAMEDIPSGYTPTVLPLVPTEVDYDSPRYVAVYEDMTDLVYYEKATVDPSLIFITDAYLNPNNVTKKDTWVSGAYCYNYTGTDAASGSNKGGEYCYVYQKLTGTPTIAKYYNEKYDCYSELPITESYWNSQNTYARVPIRGRESSPEVIRVPLPNGGFNYYQKVKNFDNSGYLHDIWYQTRNHNAIGTSENDLDFQRKLYVLGDRILSSKGTRESIEMLMSLFGLGIGEYDESSSDFVNGDFSINEEYRKSNHVKATDLFYYYIADSDESAVEWDDSNTFETIPLNSTAESVTPIRVGDDEDGYRYFTLHSDTWYNAITRVNMNKGLRPEYETVFSGVPLEQFGDYIMPYYYNDRYYDSDIIFQSKGGWAKSGTDIKDLNTYTETVSYLHIKPNVTELLNLLSTEVKNGDIYYVSDTTDYADFAGETPADLSHYFKLIDDYTPSDIESWRYIPATESIRYNSYTSPDGTITHDDYLRVMYLENILSTNDGNNPHCGYGEYDMGEEYMEYMAKPFKYTYDNADGTVSQDIIDMAYQIAFSVEKEYDSDKIKRYGSYVKYEKGNYGYTRKVYTIEENSPIINSKVVTITNHLVSNSYKQYFKNVILPYLLQVIPSTTILILKGFEMIDEREAIFYDIQANVCGEGTVSGTGRYVDTSNTTLVAIAADGYHFVGWAKGESCDGEIIETGNTLINTVHGDATYTAVFEKNCNIYIGCEESCGVQFDSDSEDTCSVVFLTDTEDDN